MAGRIEESTRLNVAGLNTAHPMSDALAELAFSLAKSLDTGADAQLSRELRATLAELASIAPPDGDDFASDLSTPVRGDGEQ